MRSMSAGDPPVASPQASWIAPVAFDMSRPFDGGSPPQQRTVTGKRDRTGRARPKREAQHEANVEAAVAKIQNAAAVLQSSTSSLQRKHEAVSVVTHAAATDGRRYRVCYKVTADAIARAGCVPGLVALLADHFATE